MTGWNSKRVKVDRFPVQGKTGLRKPVQKQLQIRAKWNNVAGDEQFSGVIASHRKWLPKTEAKQVPDLKKPRKPKSKVSQ